MNLFEERRKLLLQEFPDTQILILGNDLSPINYTDNTYPFRQDSTFLYFTGLKRQGLAIILDGQSQLTTLIADQSGPDEIVWTGLQTDLHEVAASAGITNVISWAEFYNSKPKDLSYLPPYRSKHILQLQSLGIKDIQPSAPLRDTVIRMRQYKDDEEIGLMEEAARLSGQMHRQIISAASEGQVEYELVAKAYQFAFSRDLTMAYSPILTTNGHILHNHQYNNRLKSGDLVLNDSGIETKYGYCGDISRTFPVSGQFTSIQEDVYNAVLSGYNTAVNMAAPGVKFLDVHLACSKAMVESLISIGWMKGNAQDAVDAGAHTVFFPHGLGHMIGMDVHDMENLGEEYVGYNFPHKKSEDFGTKYLRLGKILEPRFCLTIEPGIYINRHLIERMEADESLHEFVNFETLKKHYNFGGIRLEDNFVITENGIRNLDGTLPLEAKAIEEIRQNAMESRLSPM